MTDPPLRHGRIYEISQVARHRFLKRFCDNFRFSRFISGAEVHDGQ